MTALQRIALGCTLVLIAYTIVMAGVCWRRYRKFYKP